MTVATDPQSAEPVRGAVLSWKWAVQRAVLGLAIMFAVTGVAAYIAYASIDASADGIEQGAGGIKIGTPAAPMVKPE